MKTPRLLNDGKTFVLLCATRRGQHYGLSFNAEPEGGFANTAEHRAVPTSLTFSTTTDEPIRSLGEAMTAQHLTKLEIPVQELPEASR